MKEQYPNPIVYTRLYERFFDPTKTGHMLDLAGKLQGKRVLDLCCGDGRLGLESLRRQAASVVFVDREAAMINQVRQNLLNNQQALYRKRSSCEFSIEDVEQFLLMPRAKFDRVFCQQGVNYWLGSSSLCEPRCENMAERLSKVVAPGGMFIFNTFENAPSDIPWVREYQLQANGDKFVEVSWLLGNTVHHIQVRQGMEHHHTTFRWITVDEYTNWLSPFFSVNYEQKGNSLVFCCIRK